MPRPRGRPSGSPNHSSTRLIVRRQMIVGGTYVVIWNCRLTAMTNYTGADKLEGGLHSRLDHRDEGVTDALS